MSRGEEILKRIEDHCGAAVNDRRLKYHIEQEIERLIAETESIKSRVSDVLNGHKTYDPKHKKAIYTKTEKTA